MTDALLVVAAALGLVALFVVRAVAEHEYDTWAALLARLLVRLAGRIHAASRDEWWAEIVQVQRERDESGLGYAVTTLLSSIRLAGRRTPADTPVPEPTAVVAPDPAPVAVPYHDTLGRRIRAVRKGRRLSQERLAERCGLHRTYIGCVERDEVNPTLYSIVVIAVALDVDPGELVQGLGPDEALRSKRRRWYG